MPLRYFSRKAEFVVEPWTPMVLPFSTGFQASIIFFAASASLSRLSTWPSPASFASGESFIAPQPCGPAA